MNRIVRSLSRGERATRRRIVLARTYPARYNWQRDYRAARRMIAGGRYPSLSCSAGLRAAAAAVVARLGVSLAARGAESHDHAGRKGEVGGSAAGDARREFAKHYPNGFHDVPLGQLDAISDPENPGVSVDDRLLKSMQAHGQKDPAEVGVLNGSANLEDGKHRLVVAKRLGWKTLRVEVYGNGMTA